MHPFPIKNFSLVSTRYECQKCGAIYEGWCNSGEFDYGVIPAVNRDYSVVLFCPCFNDIWTSVGATVQRLCRDLQARAGMGQDIHDIAMAATLDQSLPYDPLYLWCNIACPTCGSDRTILIDYPDSWFEEGKVSRRRWHIDPPFATQNKWKEKSPAEQESVIREIVRKFQPPAR